MAGPITWSYHTTVTYAQDYGANFRVMLHPNGTVTNSPDDNVGYAKLFYSTGNPMPEAGSHTANYQFQVTVKITDAASGLSSDQVWNGSYTSQWSYPAEYANQPDMWYWDFEQSTFGGETDRRSFTLGNTRYTVWATSGGDEPFPSAELGVQTDSIQATPEPATLALAGMGIGMVVLGRRRLR